MRRLITQGSPKLTEVPYYADCDYLDHVDLAPEGSDPGRLRIGSFASFAPMDVSPTLIKRFLANDQAVALGGLVYDNYVNPTIPLSAGIYYGGTPVPDSGHGQLLVGYDDRRGDPKQGLGAFLV